jgi:methionine synthase I (cobalamin-dependent)
MTSFRERLARGPCLLFDGGMGTLLMARGLVAGEAPDGWNLDRSAEVTAIHRAYVEAGAEAIQTNTFGAHPLRLARAGLAGRCAEICAAAVAAARAAVPRFVVGDLGPTGEYLSPIGNGDPQAFRRGFAEQARALAAAGVDALHIETQSDLREARIALEAAKSAAPDLPVLVSLTFERKPRGFFTIMGDRLVPALGALAEAGADAVGANCSITSVDMVSLAHEALAALSARLVFQPNAGQPERGADGRLSYAQQPNAFAADLAPLARAGAAALGGCCGTDPRFIAALAVALAEKG